MQTEAARDNQLKAFIEFLSQIKKLLIELFQCESPCSGVQNHANLRLVEKGPHLIDRLEVIPRYFVELPFGGVQLFLALSTHHLVIKVEEPLDLGHLIDLKGRQTQEKLVESLKKPGIQLRPVGWEVVMDKDSCHQGKLFIRLLHQNYSIWVLDHGQQLGFDVIFQLVC